MAIRGFLPLPRARRIAAARLYTMTTGSPANRIRRYAMEIGRISWGVRSRDTTAPTAASLISVSDTAHTAARTMALVMTCRSFPYSPAPNFWAIRMEKPWAKPWMIPRVSQFSQSTAPSAASASTPSTLPTTAVSTMVYICWKMFPAIRGRENRSSSFQGAPSVNVFTSFFFRNSVCPMVLQTPLSCPMSRYPGQTGRSSPSMSGQSEIIYRESVHRNLLWCRASRPPLSRPPDCRIS